MITINLLRQPARRQFSFGGVQTKIIGAAVMTMALVILGGFYWYWSLSDQVKSQWAQIQGLQKETRRLKNVQTQMQRFERQKAELDRRLAVVRRLRGSRQGPVRLLSSLVNSVPEDPSLWLTSLKQKGGSLSIEGRSFDVGSLASFIDRLSNHRPPFRAVELEFWERDGQTIRFKLNSDVENQ